MARKIYTQKGEWTIFGTHFTQTDSLYFQLIKAINTGKLDQDYLQEVTGHRSPIIVNHRDRTIQFCSW